MQDNMQYNMQDRINEQIRVKQEEQIHEYLKQKKLDPEGFFTSMKEKIIKHTEVTNENSLTPEIKLHLSTPKCSMYEAKPEDAPFPLPFWAYYWVGGQALTRYLLDNGNIIKGKTVIDIGSGCGSLAIAAAKLGVAASVTANEIDPIAEVAIKLNMEINGCKPKSIKLLSDNILERTVAAYKWDCIFLGDMFYDQKMNSNLMDWLLRSSKPDVDIFIGDPIRHSEIFSDFETNLEKVAEYTMSDEDMKMNLLEKNTIGIWKLIYKKK